MRKKTIFLLSCLCLTLGFSIKSVDTGISNQYPTVIANEQSDDRPYPPIIKDTFPNING